MLLDAGAAAAGGDGGGGGGRGRGGFGDVVVVGAEAAGRGGVGDQFFAVFGGLADDFVVVVAPYLGTERERGESEQRAKDR